MGELDHKIFEKKGQIYWKWLMRINSRRLVKPVHFIWLTDKTDNQTTKMILNKSKNIVGAYDHRLLFNYLEDHKRNIPDPVNTFTWLNEVRDLEDIAVTLYDVDLIENALDTKSFNKAIMYECVDFINLCTDLAEQVQDDWVFELSEMRQIRALWNFGNNEIFWKEWGHSELAAVKIPPFITNFTLLKKRMHLLIETFISRIDILDQKKSSKGPRKENMRRVLRIPSIKRRGKR